MRNTLIFNILLVCLMAVSCTEWTTPESLEFEKNSIHEIDPELYSQYCTAVKSYKEREHKLMYVTFENVDKISNGSHNLATLPDSVDFVQFHNLEVDQNTLDLVNATRETFGTKFVLRFSYNECLAAYEALVNESLKEDEEAQEGAEAQEEDAAEEEVTEPALPIFEEYLAAEFAKVTGKVAEYGFDGFTFAYVSGNPYEMTAEKREAVTKEQELVFPMLSEWIAANENTLFFYEGQPQYVLAEGIVTEADYVILTTRNERSVGDLAYIALQAVNSGKVAKETKLLFSVETPSFLEEEFQVGQFLLGEQIPIAADWMMEESSFNKSGLVVWNVQRDYFDTQLTYSTVRRAIKTMNPNE